MLSLGFWYNRDCIPFLHWLGQQCCAMLCCCRQLLRLVTRCRSPDLLSAARGKLGPGQKKYRLFAVVYHAGKESTKGHYITDAYHPAYQQWVRYDDSTVTAVTESSVLKPESPLMPYILFYRRLEPHAAAHNGK